LFVQFLVCIPTAFEAILYQNNKTKPIKQNQYTNDVTDWWSDGHCMTAEATLQNGLVNKLKPWVN